MRDKWGIATLVVGLVLAACGISSTAGASTTHTYRATAAGVAQPLRVSQLSTGPVTGMTLLGSPSVVWVYGQPGEVTFILSLTNKGKAPYNCQELQATQNATKGPYVAGTSPWMSCPGPGQSIPPGSTEPVVFFLPGSIHPTKDIVVRPYDSNVGQMVWNVAGCPTVPKSCLGRFQKLPVSLRPALGTTYEER